MSKNVRIGLIAFTGSFIGSFVTSYLIIESHRSCPVVQPAPCTVEESKQDSNHGVHFHLVKEPNEIK